MAEVIQIVRRAAKPGPSHTPLELPLETPRERKLSTALAAVLSINIFVVSTVLSLGYLLIFMPR